MKRAMGVLFLVVSITLSGGFVFISQAQGKRYKLPLTEEQMKPYEKVAFSIANFDKIQRGMTQLEVLKLLGKPIKVTKEHRKHNRWTVHYFYPEDHVVNFKDGLVVGKE